MDGKDTLSLRRRQLGGHRSLLGRKFHRKIIERKTMAMVGAINPDYCFNQKGIGVEPKNIGHEASMVEMVVVHHSQGVIADETMHLRVGASKDRLTWSTMASVWAL